MANEFALIPSWRTAFVTGAAGFIASNLVDRLLSEGLTVIGYDNFSTGMPEFVVPAKGSERFNLIEGDLLDAERVVQAMQGAEFVFHLAANADVRRGLEHPHKDLEQNTIATFNVLEGMRKNGIGGIAFPSTGPVYGEPTIFPTPEDAPFPVQTSLYGASKLACEGMISAYCEGYRMRAWIFRFVSILGERYTHGHVYDFVRQLRENPKVLPVLGNGLQRKSYLYIQDCINAIFTAVSRAEGKVNIFNLGAEDYCEVRELGPLDRRANGSFAGISIRHQRSRLDRRQSLCVSRHDAHSKPRLETAIVDPPGRRTYRRLVDAEPLDLRKAELSLMRQQAVILAGGLGTRLSALTGRLPKALVDVAGKPLIIRQLDLVARHQYTDVLLLLRHGAEAIIAACGTGVQFGLKIDYIIEDEARGTAGAVLMARDRLQERFAVLYGDTVLNVDLARMQAAHHAAGADVTLFVHPNDHPHDSDLVEVDAAQRIIAFHSKPHAPGAEHANIVSAALYMIEARSLGGITPPPGVFDFGAHLFPNFVESGAHLLAYRSREYIKDAGTPERLAAVATDVQSGRVAAGSLETAAPAIFLDRDGTLNDDPGHISRPEQLQLFPGAGEAVRRINKSPYVAALVTNQPVVARGDVDEAGLQRIHDHLEYLLGESGAYLDAIYYCPHHPDRGFPGERPELKINAIAASLPPDSSSAPFPR